MSEERCLNCDKALDWNADDPCECPTQVPASKFVSRSDFASLQQAGDQLAQIVECARIGPKEIPLIEASPDLRDALSAWQTVGEGDG